MKKSIETKGAVETREELEKCMGEFAAARYALEAAKLEKEVALSDARERFEQIEPSLKAAVEAPFRQLELWARNNPAEFGAKKSLELVQGVIGFRTGQPRVVLPRGTDEETLCDLLGKAGLGAAVRTVRVLDREAVVRAARSENPADREFAAALAGMFGIKVSQTERFFAEERREEKEAE